MASERSARILEAMREKSRRPEVTATAKTMIGLAVAKADQEGQKRNQPQDRRYVVVALSTHVPMGAASGRGKWKHEMSLL